MTFAAYYNGPFRNDLARVVGALPPMHEHAPGELTLQPRSISRRNPVVRRWSDERRMLFAAGLFLTVLADQVCYTHFPASYQRFHELTMYPKWRGDCPGACFGHIPPATVFQVIGAREGALGSIRELPFAAFPDDLWFTMRSEVVDFVRRHLPDLDPEEFWRRCDAEVPTEFRMLYLASRHRVV